MKEKIKKHKKKILVVGIILILVTSIVAVKAGIGRKQRAMMQNMPRNETASIEKRTLMNSISATGSITSAESMEISVSLSNVEVENVNVKVGDTINRGDILCTFNSEDIEKSLEEAKASLNVTSVKTQIDVSSSERSLAEAVESSNIELSRIMDDMNDALSSYEDALEDIKEAEDAYNSAKNTAASYKTQLASLNSQKSSLESEKNTYITQFTNAKASVLEYISSDSDITLSNDSFEALTISDSFIGNAASICIISNDVDGSKETAINEKITEMQTASASYNAKDWDTEITNISSQLTSIQKQYESAQQSINTLENTYEQAVATADSKYDAYEQKVRSKEDTIRSNQSTIANKTDSVTTSKLNASTSGTSEKNQVEQYEEQLEDCTVTAPISGIITALNIEAGNIYSGTAIATIEDISAYKITTEIDEYDIVNIETGQKVVIKTNGTGDLELDGTVETIAPRATSNSGNSSDVTYTVTISVDTPCDSLKLDMTAKLSIILESKENVLTVPYNAVQEDENGNFYIETPLQSKRIYITKGIESDYYIEISGDEITEGMQVVVPQTEDTQSIQKMMMRQGPMGGF